MAGPLGGELGPVGVNMGGQGGSGSRRSGMGNMLSVSLRRSQLAVSGKNKIIACSLISCVPQYTEFGFLAQISTRNGFASVMLNC
jgi:hypothetical protein